MAAETAHRRECLPVCLAFGLATAALLWPALWNGYPIVFADTGTYLSQAVHHYLGWDRPVFYSLVVLPLHLTTSLWPVVVAQAALTLWMLHLACRVLGCGVWTVPLLAGVLAATSWLPWLVSEVMPDLLTPLLVLALWLLAVMPERLSRAETAGLVAAAALMIAAQQSSLPLAVALLCGLLPLRLWLDGRSRRTVSGGTLRGRMPRGWVLRDWTLHGPFIAFVPPLAAAVALIAVNAIGHGRWSLAPFGNMFTLARVIYDGPGLAVLQRDCPGAGWRLCPYLDRMPDTSDQFLWRPDSPVMLAGGHKAVTADADAIVLRALWAQPGQELRAIRANFAGQLQDFASGDGLNPWPLEVSPWIRRDFPSREWASYQAARQQRGLLAVPAWLAMTHRWVALAGVVACLALLPGAIWRRHPAAGLIAAILLAVPANALITGSLSGPHDRYQSRMMWLPPAAALIAATALLRRRTA